MALDRDARGALVIHRALSNQRRPHPHRRNHPCSVARTIRTIANPKRKQDQTPTGPEEVDAGDIIRVNTTLVTIPVSVMDRDGRYVPNLQKEEFRIWEDGVEQDVAFFQSVDKPFSVVLMLDTSPSTQFRLEDIQDAAISFVNQLRSDDKVMVVSFNDDIKILSEFTTDRRKLERAIQRAKTDDGTRLYDAVDMVINQQLSRVQGRKAIVLLLMALIRPAVAPTTTATSWTRRSWMR